MASTHVPLSFPECGADGLNNPHFVAEGANNRNCGPRNAQDLSLAYKNNFGLSTGSDGSAANAPLIGTPKGVEAVIVGVIYKRFVMRLIERFSWIRSSENVGLYADARSLMHYVKTAHGSVFRRVVLSGMLESAQKIVKVDAEQSIESNRESPGGSCSVVDENEKQLSYKKSMFRRRNNTTAGGEAGKGNMVKF